MRLVHHSEENAWCASADTAATNKMAPATAVANLLLMVLPF
jgi:hypothetical protein